MARAAVYTTMTPRLEPIPATPCRPGQLKCEDAMFRLHASLHTAAQELCCPILPHPDHSAQQLANACHQELLLDYRHGV